MDNGNYFKYILDISGRAIMLELNRVPIFEARYSNLLFNWRVHVILVKGTGKKYRLKTFRHSVIFWGEERIELYDDQKEMIMKFNLDYRYKNLFSSYYHIYDSTKKSLWKTLIKKN